MKELRLNLKRIHKLKERIKNCGPSRRLNYWLLMEVQEREHLLSTVSRA